uniref:ADF-H domain-containing protein n=1 Tax=Steinernema glaseri TaxID=37863 RepID=A0A1I7XZ01_9BILA
MYDIEGDEDDEVRVYSKCTFAVDGELLAVQKEVQELRGKVSRDHLAAVEHFTFQSAAEEVDRVDGT